MSGQTASEQQSNETMMSPQDANRAAANVATSLESLRQSIRSVDAVPEVRTCSLDWQGMLKTDDYQWAVFSDP